MLSGRRDGTWNDTVVVSTNQQPQKKFETDTKVGNIDIFIGLLTTKKSIVNYHLLYTLDGLVYYSLRC